MIRPGIASPFRKGYISYREKPTALHLRAMKILYAGLKEKGALMLMPSTAVELMRLGACWARLRCGRRS
jgi:hypothetical protein